MASSPYEVQLAADVAVYYAPSGETFPLIDDADPASIGNWDLLADCEHITEAGIVLRTATQIQVVRALCSVNAVKVSITSKDIAFEFEVMDTRLEAVALGDGQDPATAVIATAAGGGAAGFKTLGFSSSPIPQGFSILFRWGQSGYMDLGNSQIEVPSAVQSGDGSPTWSKTTPWAWKHLWTAQKQSGDPIASFVEQTTIAS